MEPRDLIIQLLQFFHHISRETKNLNHSVQRAGQPCISQIEVTNDMEYQELLSYLIETFQQTDLKVATIGDMLDTHYPELLAQLM